MFDINTDDFDDALRYMLQNTHKESTQIIRRMGQMCRKIIVARAKKEVKSKGGTYHKRWKLGKVWVDNGEYKIRVFNNAPHAHLIEDGHRIVVGGKLGEGGQEVGFVPGKKVIDKANREIESKWSTQLRKEIDRMIDKM